MLPIRDTIPSAHPPVTMWLVIAANVATFVFELSLGGRARQAFFYLYGVVPLRFTEPAWAEQVGLDPYSYWSFLTSMFLHAGWMHIIFNMWALWIFADNVEDRMGHVRFGLFYLLCGVAATAVHVFANAEATVPVVGASGALAGVMGAYVVMYPAARVVVLLPVLFFPLFFELPALVYVGVWFLTQLYSGALALGGAPGAGVAWWAHIGGFVTGIALHRLFLRRRGPPRVRVVDGDGERRPSWRRPPRVER